MRKVRIKEKIFEIPSDREWVLCYDESVGYPKKEHLTTEYRFLAHPNNYVKVRSRRRKILELYGQTGTGHCALAEPEQWEDMGTRPLSEFLIEDPSSDRWRGIDFSEVEKRYSNYANPCNEVSRNYPEWDRAYVPQDFQKRTWFRDPVKSIFEEHFTLDRAAHAFLELDSIRGDFVEEKGGSAIKMDKVKSFQTGTRVVFRDSFGNTERATVVGRVPEMRGAKYRSGSILLCTDTSSPYYTHHNNYTGHLHGLVVEIEKDNVRRHGGFWNKVHKDIGVYVPNSFEHENLESESVSFPAYSTGRIISLDESKGMIRVSWNLNDLHFGTDIDKDTGENIPNVWEVPLNRVRICLLQDNVPSKVWPAFVKMEKEFKVGDLCCVVGRTTSILKQNQEVVLPDNTVVELHSYSKDRNKNWECKIVGGCQESLLGGRVVVRSSHMYLHPAPEQFYKPGQIVEIVAQIDFRKVPLKGMRGRVILSTDQDGDVGIELPRDIGAGSLDGIGKEGRCIYIEASLVKASG